MENKQAHEEDAQTAQPAEEAGKETNADTQSTPFRQLLHWATGDRDAEAKALADETLARQDPSEDNSSSTATQLREAVLAAAKGAVSTAHGDSLVPNTFGEPESQVPGTPDAVSKAPNLLTEWEEAGSFTKPTGEKQDHEAGNDSDVARPIDVDAIIDDASKP